MVPKVIIDPYGDLIDIQFTLADDCKFDAVLDVKEAQELVKRLQEAIAKAGE
jgi:hypothetical protein